MKSMVEKFGVEKARRTSASPGVPTLTTSGRAINSRVGGIYVKFPVPGGCRGAHVGDNDDTAGYRVRGTRCGEVLEPWTGALLKDGDVGHILPAPHERVGDHVRWAGRWTQHEGIHDWECLVPG